MSSEPSGQLLVNIFSPQKVILKEFEASKVQLPAEGGQIGILPGHARLIAKLSTGELEAFQGVDAKRFKVDGGYVIVEKNHVTVLSKEIANA